MAVSRYGASMSASMARTIEERAPSAPLTVLRDNAFSRANAETIRDADEGGDLDRARQWLSEGKALRDALREKLARTIALAEEIGRALSALEAHEGKDEGET